MAHVSKARKNPHSHSQCRNKTKRLAPSLRICFKEIESKTKKEIQKEYKKGWKTDVVFLLSFLFVSFTRCFGIIGTN